LDLPQKISHFVLDRYLKKKEKEIYYFAPEILVTYPFTIGALLNATFGNAVELIIAIIALKEGEIRVVQASVMGSIIPASCCFLAGGISFITIDNPLSIASIVYV